MVAALAAVGAWALLGLGGSGQPPRPGPGGWPAGVGGLAGISRIVVPAGLRRLAKPRPRPHPAREEEEAAGHPRRDPGPGEAEPLEPPARDEPASSAEPEADAQEEPERGDPDFWFDRDGDGGGSAPPEEEMDENDRRSPQRRFIDGLEGGAGCEVSTEAFFSASAC